MSLDNWVIIYNGRNNGDVTSFVNQLKTTCRSIGMQCADPTMLRVPDDRTPTFICKIKESYAGVSEMENNKFLVLCCFG